MLIPALVLIFGLVLTLVVVSGLARAQQVSQARRMRDRHDAGDDGRKQGLLSALLRTRWLR